METNQGVHRHHHRHMDESEIFKNKNLQAKQRRRFLKKFMLITLTLLAILVMLAVFYAYFIDRQP